MRRKLILQTLTKCQTNAFFYYFMDVIENDLNYKICVVGNTHSIFQPLLKIKIKLKEIY